MARRATTGRQRVEIKKIENPDALQVTFSKRRSGLFKKACELAILCGAEVLILVFSPAGRPYSFGSPDVQSLVDRYVTGNPTHVVDPYMGKGLLVQSLADEFTDLTNIRDRERTQISNLRQIVKDLGAPNEEDLSVNELEQYVASLDALKARLAHHIEQLKSMEDNYANLNTPLYTGPQDGANMFVPMDAIFHGEHMNHMLPTHINVPHPHNSAMGFMNFPYNHHINMLEPTDYYYAGNFEFDYAGNIVQAPVAKNNLVIPGNPNDIGASGVNDYHGVPPFGGI